MAKGVLALLIQGSTDNWSPERWKDRFLHACSDRRVALLPSDKVDPDEIRYAAVWKPTRGALSAFPNLRVIFNLGAGVDALVADPNLPKIPLVRVVIDDLTKRMTEYVVLQVSKSRVGVDGKNRSMGSIVFRGSPNFGSFCREPTFWSIYCRSRLTHGISSTGSYFRC
jgi:hypothetical protein